MNIHVVLEQNNNRNIVTMEHQGGNVWKEGHCRLGWGKPQPDLAQCIDVNLICYFELIILISTFGVAAIILIGRDL